MLTQEAVICAGRFGGASEIELLQPPIAQTKVVGSATESPGPIFWKKELRDEALAQLLVLTGQTPEDYGFDGGRDQRGVHNHHGFRKNENEKREKAHQEWQNWWKDNGQKWMEEHMKTEPSDDWK